MSVEMPPDTPPSMPSTTVSTTAFASVEMTIIAGASDEFWRENPLRKLGYGVALLLSWQIMSSLASRCSDRWGSTSIAALTVAPPPKSDARLHKNITPPFTREA
ncbi:hypothetical protein QJS10_CPB20g01323 [Acorus calamus]|uniref:Uncharacterized protein n=1 Tax=Acorus calamus TaxID=4465 RepID=A0AAV9C9K9_ACOCL|nr:hypothetical protein QJS10_CPB20g01323 [Acorus calamus]